MTKDITNKVGYEFTPYQFTIERGKIKEFALAIGDDHPIYYHVEEARKAGFRDIPLPPTFATAIDLWGGPDFEGISKELGMDYLKILHGEQSYEYVKDICAGDVISANMYVIDAVVKKGMNLFTTETKYTNEDDELVLIARATIIERH